MSINESGKWWVGTDTADIGDYLRAYSEDNYQTSEFRLAKCSCGSEVEHFVSGEGTRSPKLVWSQET